MNDTVKNIFEYGIFYTKIARKGNNIFQDFFFFFLNLNQMSKETNQRSKRLNQVNKFVRTESLR